MKILVTGGAGFIGTNVVRGLMKHGHEPVVLDDLSTGLLSNIPKGINFLNGCITEIKSVREACAGVEAIVHLAARGSVPRSIRNPVLTYEVNVEGTANILEVARKNKLRVIFTSSSSVYGANTVLPKNEEMVLKPLTPYAASKMSGEALMMGYGKTYDLYLTTLRLFNVFGSWQRPDHDYSAVIPKWIWQAMTNQVIEVYGDGEQSRDFTSVNSVVTVIIQALENKIHHPEPINLAFGNKITLNQIILKIKNYFPQLEVRYQDTRQGDVYASQNDPVLINQIFPNIQLESFDNSLKNTIKWMKKESKKIVGGPKVND